MCIQYFIALKGGLIQIGKALDFISAFFNLNSEINAIYLTFIKKLGFVIQSININIQKIDSIIFETYKMVIAVFLVINWADKIKFFEKTFLIANFSLNMIFKILFLTLNSRDINFLKRKL